MKEKILESFYIGDLLNEEGVDNISEFGDFIKFEISGFSECIFRVLDKYGEHIMEVAKMVRFLREVFLEYLYKGFAFFIL
jgi:hypothetical protein